MNCHSPKATETMTKLSSSEMSEVSGGNEALIDAAKCYAAGGGYAAAIGTAAAMSNPAFAAATIGMVVGCVAAAY